MTEFDPIADISRVKIPQPSKQICWRCPAACAATSTSAPFRYAFGGARIQQHGAVLGDDAIEDVETGKGIGEVGELASGDEQQLQAGLFSAQQAGKSLVVDMSLVCDSSVEISCESVK